MRRVVLTFAALVLAAGFANAQMMGSGAGGNGGPGGYDGMMGGGYGGYGGMMGGGWWASPPPTDAKTLTLDQAVQTVNQFLKGDGNPDLEIAEVMDFEYNFYAQVKEKSTGIHAFELLINKVTGEIVPEPGPNMMWNSKYGSMGYGMMGGGMMGGPGLGWGGPGGYRAWQNPSKEMTVTSEQARKYGQQFLDARLPGTTVAKDADVFYGYYTIHVMKDSKIYGMLSVNGYTGWVWYHSWHGAYISMKGFGEQ